MRLAYLVSHPIQYQAPLFRELARRPGVDFTALFCHDHGVQPTFDAQFGRVIRYDVPLLEGYSCRFLRNLAPRASTGTTGQINPEVLVSIAAGEFDAVIAHGYSTITNLLAVLGPRRHTRILMRGDSNLTLRRTPTKRVIKQIILRGLFSCVDHFLPVGTHNRAYYASYGVADDRMTFAPYSVDNDHFVRGAAEARRDPNAARHKLGLPSNIPLFLFCAKMISKKRPLDALHAIARVRAHTPCGLVYVGDGELSSQVDGEIERKELNPYVYRLGFRNQSELPFIYGACDALVLPSDNEPWGLVVNEAMAAGMTAIVSDQVGAGPDLADPDCIFPAGDIGALAVILQRLATDPIGLSAAKGRAFERIQRWGLSQTADGFVRGAEAAIRV